jgi:hypothetical protein
MTTLYRPVLIESAEQAEALPRGTVATCGGGNITLTAHRITSIAAKPDAWNGMDDLLSSSDMVGWRALVPIEAEEERQAIAECEIGIPGTERIVHEHRFVTPWEER